MNQCNNENLYAATRDFLACITDAQMLYDSKKLTQFEESMVRTKLRDCFEQYMQTLSVKENNFGPIMTRRSREFVEVEINAFIETANQFAGELEILALGPLTNIAIALALDPALPSKVKRLIIMGGAITGKGNITAFAEFNIAVDPESAQSVLTGWPNAELVDWEATLQNAPTIAQTESWLSSGAPNAQLMHAISRETLAFHLSIAEPGLDHAAAWTWADPLAAFVAINPTLCDFQRFGVEVIMQGPARGATMLDQRKSDVRVAANVQTLAFHALMQACLAH